MTDTKEIDRLRDELATCIVDAAEALGAAAEALELEKLACRSVRERLADMHNARVASCLEQACPCPCHHAGEV